MMEEKYTYSYALTEAQELGIAEADPAYDVDGIDTAGKVVILANSIFGMDAKYDDVSVTGIRDITPEALNLAWERGYLVKLIGEVPSLTVKPMLVPRRAPSPSAGPSTSLHRDRPLGTITVTGLWRRLHRDRQRHRLRRRQHLHIKTDRRLKPQIMTSFESFAELCKKIEEIGSSLEKTALLASFLSELDEAELAVVPSFVMGSPFPASSEQLLGVGPSTLYDALSRASGLLLGDQRYPPEDRGRGGRRRRGGGKRKPATLSAFIEADGLSILDVYSRFRTSPGPREEEPVRQDEAPAVPIRRIRAPGGEVHR